MGPHHGRPSPQLAQEKTKVLTILYKLRNGGWAGDCSPISSVLAAAARTDLATCLLNLVGPARTPKKVIKQTLVPYLRNPINIAYWGAPARDMGQPCIHSKGKKIGACNTVSVWFYLHGSEMHYHPKLETLECRFGLR